MEYLAKCGNWIYKGAISKRTEIEMGTLAMDQALDRLPEADRRIPQGNDWLSPAELAALTPAELVRRARELAPLLAAHASEAERLRRPVDAVWEALRASGIFYLFVPKAYGGLEFDLETYVDVIIALGEGCVSTAWVASFCIEHNWIMALFPKAAQDEIFATHPYIIAPATSSPPGRATAVDGGFRVTGRWKWGTGVMHADWVFVAALLEGAAPPKNLFLVLPADQATAVDTWHMDGMAATGSNDVAVNDIFVPAHRVIEWKDMGEGRTPGSRLHDNPLYRLPMLPFLAVAAAGPGVGLARATARLFRDRLEERVMKGDTGKQAEKPAAQMRLARADVMTRTAELLIRNVASETIALARRGSPATPAERTNLRTQVAFAMELCRDAIRTVCEGSGSSAHALDSPLQRALRDINVMSTHAIYDMDVILELQGRAMIGLPPNSTLV